ncbi:MAG: hypothetical protein OXG84_15565, partial [Chloroflexi bacterium]|nr:hypothetical protein [Chloroflexota bacterium]
RKWHISQTILGALAFLGALGGKAFYVSTEKDTLPLLAIDFQSDLACYTQVFSHPVRNPKQTPNGK